MKKTVTIIAAFFLCVAILNCSRKPISICGLRYIDSRSNIDSKVLRLECIAVADTTIASVSGIIFGKDSSEYVVTIDTLISAIVILVDKETKKVYNTSTGNDGKYHLFVPASTYDLRVYYISYNTLIVRNISLGTGEIVECNAVLGQSGIRDDSTVFEMLPDKTIIRLNNQ
jgi:hypothetical protein